MVAEYRSNPENARFEERVTQAVLYRLDGDGRFQNEPAAVRATAGWVVGGTYGKYIATLLWADFVFVMHDVCARQLAMLLTLL
jgi:hypothetical protein